MYIDIIEKDAMKVIGRITRTKIKRAGIAIGWLLWVMDKRGIYKKIPNMVDPNLFYGISIDFSKDVNGVCSYMFGTEVSTYKEIPEDMETRTIPPSKYVRLFVNLQEPSKNELLNVKNSKNVGALTRAAFEYLQNKWIPESGYERADMSEVFEMYDLSKIKEGIFICIPIK